MRQTEFVNNFASTKNSYNWYYVNNQLVGVAYRGNISGKAVNPITAVAYSLTGEYYEPTNDGTLEAASALGLTESLTTALMSSGTNRGHAQIIRGKLLKKVYVK